MMALKSEPQRKGITKSFFEVFFAAWIFTLPWSLPAIAAENPENGRERLEVIKEINNFRKERDDFFKNHPRSPLKRQDKFKFDHLRYFPADLKYRFQGKIERYTIDIRDQQFHATFLTNKGTKKRYVRYGQFRFILNGKENVLQIYKSILSDTLFIPFKDQTNGRETYSGGRYLDAEILLPGYETTIDFNMAYNPSCAYNENFTCVIPPDENVVDLKIEAGEKNFRGQ